MIGTRISIASHDTKGCPVSKETIGLMASACSEILKRMGRVNQNVVGFEVCFPYDPAKQLNLGAEISIGYRSPFGGMETVSSGFMELAELREDDIWETVRHSVLYRIEEFLAAELVRLSGAKSQVDRLLDALGELKKKTVATGDYEEALSGSGDPACGEG